MWVNIGCSKSIMATRAMKGDGKEVGESLKHWNLVKSITLILLRTFTAILPDYTTFCKQDLLAHISLNAELDTNITICDTFHLISLIQIDVKLIYFPLYKRTGGLCPGPRGEFNNIKTLSLISHVHNWGSQLCLLSIDVEKALNGVDWGLRSYMLSTILTIYYSPSAQVRVNQHSPMC